MGPETAAVLGAGTLGLSIARGWVDADLLPARRIRTTRRHPEAVAAMQSEGFAAGTDNRAAVEAADAILVSVRPAQAAGVFREIAPVLDPARHTVISVAAGYDMASLRELLGSDVPVIRAMPNTAIATGDSMTCLTTDAAGRRGLPVAEALFDAVGRTRVIDEESMLAATALCGCGIAFFLRTIRAAAQGGTQIGFRADEALELAAQTALGAARLALRDGSHPEREIDRVTTPEGCTIAGLNELEHRGFSSAMIRGMLESSRRAREMEAEAARRTAELD